MALCSARWHPLVRLVICLCQKNFDCEGFLLDDVCATGICGSVAAVAADLSWAWGASQLSVPWAVSAVATTEVQAVPSTVCSKVRRNGNYIKEHDFALQVGFVHAGLLCVA